MGVVFFNPRPSPLAPSSPLLPSYTSLDPEPPTSPLPRLSHLKTPPSLCPPSLLPLRRASSAPLWRDRAPFSLCLFPAFHGNRPVFLTKTATYVTVAFLSFPSNFLMLVISRLTFLRSSLRCSSCARQCRRKWSTDSSKSPHDGHVAASLICKPLSVVNNVVCREIFPLPKA